MPAWVDLSEHQVSLNVYNSPEGKRLILRPLAPQSQIPPDITEIGFEPRGEAYERRDLQFSLPQLRKYFPKAVSREFAISEIFFRPEEPAASAAIERYQWQRNRAGGQTFGNRQEIRSLTEALFNEHVKPRLRPVYADTLSAYRAKQPTATHCSLVQVAGTGEWRLDRVGSLDECRPNPKNPAWVKKVDDFFSPAATEFGGTADDEARPQYRDGRTIPIEGDDVVDVRGGFGGSAVYLNGKVISRRGALRVEIVSTAGFFGESASATTEPMSDGWTIKGEEHPYDRQLRLSREHDEQWRKENEAREAEVRARAEASRAEGYPHLDMIDPPVGARIEEIDSGRTGTIIEYFELNDAQEPVVLFDDEPAGSSGVTIGKKEYRYRYRVIAPAPVEEAIEEHSLTAPTEDTAGATAALRAPWHVPKARFIEDARCRTNENGNVVVEFDGITLRPNLGENWTTKKAKEEVHARLVKDALQGRTIDPFPASLPTFEVLLDYLALVYQHGQRAEKNVSRLLAQLGVAGKLLAGEDGYLKVENPPYIDLVIERLPDPGGDRLYLTHYLRVNGDSVLDAEMVFDIRKNGTLRLAETATQNPFRGGELRGRDMSFANMFSKNLLDQGFGAGKVLWPNHVDTETAESTVSGPTFEVGSVTFEAIKTPDPRRENHFFWRARVVDTGAFIPAEAGSVPKLRAKLDDDLRLGLKNDIARWRKSFDLPLLSDNPIDPTSSDGYARVLASEALQLEHQDTLDAFFAERIVAVRNALRDLGWKDGDAPAILKKTIDGVIASATIDTRQVGAGRNVVGVIGKVYTLQSGEIQSIADDLTGTAEQFAGRLDEAVFKADLTPAPVASPADLYAADLMDYWVKLGKEPNRDLATQRAREFFESIATRNVDELIDRLRPSLSPLSRTWFEKVTGVSIGRTWKETKNAIRTWANEASTTLAPPWIDEAPGQAETQPAAAVAKVKVYGASESADIAAALKDVLVIARENYFTDKGAREYADSAARGNLTTSQRELGTPELVAAADRLHQACMANVTLANELTLALNTEIAAEETEVAADPKFGVSPLPESLTLVARDRILEVRNASADASHVVAIERLPSGQYKARQGSAESMPATLLTAVRWASGRIDDLHSADLRARESAERARREMDDKTREIKCYVDGLRQFLPPDRALDRFALMEAVAPFTSESQKSAGMNSLNVPKFLSSGSVRKFNLPDGAILERAGENVLRICAAGYTCEIHATEPAPEFSEDRPWIRTQYEHNAPMSFVGALASACAWLKDNQAWENKKASYPDGGQQVEMLARQYASFLHEAMPTHHDGGMHDMHRSFAVAIMDKEVDYLIGWIARSRGQNELSKKFFTKSTGRKLPATIRGITATLYAWAGFTPEQAATREIEKEAAREARLEAKRIDNDIRWNGDALSNTRVNHEGSIKTAKQFLDEILDQGYTEIRKYKSGAVDRYALVNPDIQRSHLIKGRMVDYVKAVLAKRAELELENDEVPEAEPQHALRP